jgi:hypothetical protein
MAIRTCKLFFQCLWIALAQTANHVKNIAILTQVESSVVDPDLGAAYSYIMTEVFSLSDPSLFTF